MRKLLPLTLLALPALGLACTAILGDFTVTDAGGGGDTGNDVAIGDGGSDSDVVAPPLLHCTEQNSSRVQLTNGGLHPESVRMSNLANGRVRIIVPDYPMMDGGGTPAVIQAFDFDPHNPGQKFSPITQPTPNGRVNAVARYGGVQPGFVVLFTAFNQTLGNSYFYTTRLPDSASSWNAPIELTQTSNSGGDEATFGVIDAQNDEYYIVTTSTTASVQTVRGVDALASNGNNNPFTTLQTFSPTAQSDRGDFDLTTPGIVFDGKQPFIVLSPAGNNGPPPQGAPVKVVVPGKPTLTITPPSNLNYFPSGIANALDPKTVNAAFLVANLDTINGNYRVGQFPIASIGTFDPQSLPATPPPFTSSDGGSLKDLFVGGSNQHWEVPGLGKGEQFLITGPTVDPLLKVIYGGINIAWWDATGPLRAYAGGDNRLLSDIPFIAASDIVFQTLVGSIASFLVAYLNDVSAPGNSGNQPTAGDLWVTGIGCQP